VDPGLRYRLRRAARRVAHQHRAIAECYRELGEFVAQRARADVRAGFERYREAIGAHFDLEEQVFFPAVRGADEQQKPVIAALVGGHAQMLEELERIADALESIPHDDFSRRLAGFAAMLTAHERVEEKLLSQLTDSDAGSAGAH